MQSTSQTFDRFREAVPEARRFARKSLDTVEAELLDSILVCVSELATNAVQHGVPIGGQFLLKVDSDEQRVRVECHDAKRQRPRRREPSNDDTHGRGLLLVEALASRWGVGARPFGKFVWFELDLDRQGGDRC
ncbi:ATP-binding protein [Streptomyces sp. NBC_00519]|uniref:ATP-binding protein n=1 Tax=Streptomyces sp. NBC_00519 TaxID=2975764 RepID=UPI0030E5E6FF